MAETQSTGRALYKVFRWLVVVAFIFALIAILRKPAPVAPEVTPEAVAESSQQFDAKLQQLQEAHERGESGEARFSAQEVNAVIARTSLENLSQAMPVRGKPVSAGSEPATDPPTPGTPGGASIRTAQIAFVGDQVTGQFATEMYGKEVYITIAGRLGSSNGYVTFEPTVFRVGDLSIPVSFVNSSLQQKLAEPENREKLKLPDFVGGLRVENGELVITEK